MDVYDTMQGRRPLLSTQRLWTILGPVVFRDNATFARIRLHRDCWAFLSSYPPGILVYLRDARVQRMFGDTSRYYLHLCALF